jgi:hypothetical protein
MKNFMGILSCQNKNSQPWYLIPIWKALPPTYIKSSEKALLEQHSPSSSQLWELKKHLLRKIGSATYFSPPWGECYCSLFFLHTFVFQSILLPLNFLVLVVVHLSPILVIFANQSLLLKLPRDMFSLLLPTLTLLAPHSLSNRYAVVIFLPVSCTTVGVAMR